MKKLLWAHGLVLGLMAAHGSAMAQDTAADDADQFFTMTSENDKFGADTDRHYTNGAQLNYTRVTDQPGRWVQAIGDALPFVNVGGKTATSYSFGHQIYTPDNAGFTFAQPDDQPFAGFVYGKAGFTTYAPEHTDSYELTFGLVGPSAQGEYIQKTYHEAFDFYKPRGWNAGQLKDEPILNLSYVRRNPGILAWNDTVLGKDWFADVTPHYGFAVGNAYDYVNAGGVVRFGPASARDTEVTGLTVPGLPGSTTFAKGPNWFDWYVFAGFDSRLVARNIFLDGNSFKDSPSVESRPLVGNAVAGVTMLTGKVKTSFALVQETRMFETQGESDLYGAINVGYRF